MKKQEFDTTPKWKKEPSQLWVVPAMILAIYLQTLAYQWIQSHI